MNVSIKRNLMKATKPIETGETIESQIRRMTTTNEPIDGGAPIIFTPRKDGVIDDYNVRSDKWDRALKNMEQVAINRQTQRKEWLDSLNKLSTEELLNSGDE